MSNPLMSFGEFVQLSESDDAVKKYHEKRVEHFTKVYADSTKEYAKPHVKGDAAHGKAFEKMNHAKGALDAHKTAVAQRGYRDADHYSKQALTWDKSEPK